MNQKANSEIDKIIEKTREMVTKKDEVIIKRLERKQLLNPNQLHNKTDGKITEL